MAKYQITVKIPVSQSGPRVPQRIIIEANNPLEAIRIANGQYGAEHVFQTATKVSAMKISWYVYTVYNNLKSIKRIINFLIIQNFGSGK